MQAGKIFRPAALSVVGEITQHDYLATGNDQWEMVQYVAFTNANTNINSNYSRLNAKLYAEKYAMNPNSKYKVPDGGDCTNFVSQCLLNGGISEFRDGDRQSNQVWYYDEFLGIQYYASYTWGGAHNFALHWGHLGSIGEQRAYRTIEFINSASVLREWDYFYTNVYDGDVIQLVRNFDNHVTHSMIIHNSSANTYGQSDVLYAQHTDNKKDQSFYNLMQQYAGQSRDIKILVHRISR